MTATRWKTLPPVRQDRYGYYLCRLCHRACPGTERYWCSRQCRHRFLTMSHGAYVRLLLYERDGGFCAACGVDAGLMDDALTQLNSDLLHPLLMSIHPMIVTTLRSEGWTNVKLRGRGSYPDAIKFSSCWEAHHIQAVVEGGGECGLENYKTLCVVCHKKASAELARKRKEMRQQKKNEARESMSIKKAAPIQAPPTDDEFPF